MNTWNPSASYTIEQMVQWFLIFSPHKQISFMKPIFFQLWQHNYLNWTWCTSFYMFSFPRPRCEREDDVPIKLPLPRIAPYSDHLQQNFFYHVLFVSSKNESHKVLTIIIHISLSSFSLSTFTLVLRELVALMLNQLC